MEKEALETICKEFGQCPEQLFFTPHPERVFRLDSANFPVSDSENQYLKLENYFNSLQDSHQQRINLMLEQYNSSKEKLDKMHAEEVETLTKQIKYIRELIQITTDEHDEYEKSKKKEFENLNFQHSQEFLKSSKTPNLAKSSEHELRVQFEQETSKSRVESAKKQRKIQSKTPTKPY